MLGGRNNTYLARAICDSCQWLKTIVDYPFANFGNAVLTDVLGNGGRGGRCRPIGPNFRLPTDLYNNVNALCKIIILFTRQFCENLSISTLLCSLSTSLDISVCITPP